MDSKDIIIPFDFPFAILGKDEPLPTRASELVSFVEHRHNPDPSNKLVYAVADGQYTYGPLSLYQYHNDEKYSRMYVEFFSTKTDDLSRCVPFVQDTR